MKSTSSSNSFVALSFHSFPAARTAIAVRAIARFVSIRVDPHQNDRVRVRYVHTEKRLHIKETYAKRYMDEGLKADHEAQERDRLKAVTKSQHLVLRRRGSRGTTLPKSSAKAVPEPETVPTRQQLKEGVMAVLEEHRDPTSFLHSRSQLGAPLVAKPSTVNYERLYCMVATRNRWIYQCVRSQQALIEQIIFEFYNSGGNNRVSVPGAKAAPMLDTVPTRPQLEEGAIGPRHPGNKDPTTLNQPLQHAATTRTEVNEITFRISVKVKLAKADERFRPSLRNLALHHLSTNFTYERVAQQLGLDVTHVKSVDLPVQPLEQERWKREQAAKRRSGGGRGGGAASGAPRAKKARHRVPPANPNPASAAEEPSPKPGAWRRQDVAGKV